LRLITNIRLHSVNSDSRARMIDVKHWVRISHSKIYVYPIGTGSFRPYVVILPLMESGSVRTLRYEPRSIKRETPISRRPLNGLLKSIHEESCFGMENHDELRPSSCSSLSLHSLSSQSFSCNLCFSISMSLLSSRFSSFCMERCPLLCFRVASSF
jgi:hypothetical protein